MQKKIRERYQNLSKDEKEKKATIWSRKLQKPLRRWKTKVIEKNIVEWEKNA